MAFLKGTINLTRYKVLEKPEELNNEYIAECLSENLFVEIENTAEEKSYGWVETLDHLSTVFDPVSFHFAAFITFAIRLDTRKVAARTVNRYYALEEVKYFAQFDKNPSAVTKRELKNRIKADLLRRTPLNTDLFEVIWFSEQNEIWLAASGEKVRELFEELWRESFDLSIRLMVPITVAYETQPEGMWPKISDLKPSSLVVSHEY